MAVAVVAVVHVAPGEDAVGKAVVAAVEAAVLKTVAGAVAHAVLRSNSQKATLMNSKR